MNALVFSKEPVKAVGLVVDIGSKTVGGAIYQKNAAGKIALLRFIREPIDYQNVLTGKNLLNAMLRALELLLVRLEKYCLSRFGQGKNELYRAVTADAVMSSPWHMSETKNLTLKQEKPFTVTQSLVQNLLEKEEKRFADNLLGGRRNEPNLEAFELKIIEMRLNGYSTANPYGKKASEIELRIFTSFWPKRISEKIKGLLLKHFASARPQFHSFSLAAFVSLRDFFPDLENFMLVQVGGEVTDVVIAKKDVIVEMFSFPLGHNGLIRSLDRICDNHPDCALETLLNLHRESKIALSDKKKVDDAVEEVKRSWLKLFNGAVSAVSAETFLPDTVFLFEESSYSPLFEEFLKKAESSRFTATGQSFKVKTVRDLADIFRQPNQTNDFDSVLAMEADFAARFENRL